MAVEKPSQSQIQNAADSAEAAMQAEAQATEQKAAQIAGDLQKQIEDAAKLPAKLITDVLKQLKEVAGKLSSLANGGLNAGGLELPDPDFGGLLNSATEKFKCLVPEESPVIQDLAEDLINTTIKVPFDQLKPGIEVLTSAISTAGCAIPGLDIAGLLNGIIDTVDGLITVATTKMSDEELDALATKKLGGASIMQAAGQMSQDAIDSIGKGAKDLASSAKDTAVKMAENIGKTAAPVVNAFKNFKPPAIPSSFMETIEDIFKSVQQICNNITGVMVGLIFGLIGKIFDCFNQVIGIIGVPTLPPPLDKIMELIPTVVSIFKFIMGLPMTLVTLVKAIVMKKMKMIAIAMIPGPNTPLLNANPIPPTTSADIKEMQAKAEEEANKIAAMAQL